MRKYGRGRKGLDFGAEVLKIHPLIMREFARVQKKNFSDVHISIPHMVILDILEEKGMCKMNDLAKCLNFTMSAVTAIVDKMIKLKFVKRMRSSSDRRVVNVILLEKGRKVSEEIKRQKKECANKIFVSLTERDKKEYLRIINKVCLKIKARQ